MISKQTHCLSIKTRASRPPQTSPIFYATAALCITAAPMALATPQLEEIVVTAQKREQSLQDVPLSISALTGQQLRDLGLSRPMDIGTQVPGIVMKSPNGDNSPVFTIRGIGITDFTVSNNSATSIYVDQIIKPYYPMANFSLFDLERVEILKGPQGTLYGRNNTGGAIKFVTRRPTSETDAFMRLDYGRYDTFEFEGAVGGAVADGLNARLATHTRQRNKGYQYNNLTGERNGEVDRLAGRLALDWQASENFNVNLTVNAGRSRSDVPQFKLAPPFDAEAGSPVVCAAALQGIRARDGSCVDALGQYDPDPDIDHIQSGNVQGFGLRENAWGAALQMDWVLSGAVLTSVTGFDKHERLEYQDFDGSPLIAVDNSFDQDIKSFTQELRIASDDTSSFYWIAGVFYSTDRVRNLQIIRSDNLFGVADGQVNMDWIMKTESYAAFGQIEYPIADQWELVAGLRYTYEERSFDGGSNPVTVPFLPLILVDRETDAKDLSGKIGINYRPAENVMIYLSASKGFKSGGFNGAFATNPIVYTPYGPEKLYAYELGLKSTLMDGRLRFNAAAFYYDWQDFQATVTSIDPVTNLPVQLLTNAGNARVTGIEADIQWLPTDYLTIGLAAAWNDGKIVSGELDGRDLANSPDFSANGLVRLDLPVDSLGGAIFAQSDFSYRTKYDTRIRTATTRPLVTQKGFWLVNARAGFRTENERIEVAAWIKNIFDKRYLTEVFDQGTINTLDLYNEPRTYGLSLTYNFN